VPCSGRSERRLRRDREASPPYSTATACTNSAPDMWAPNSGFSGATAPLAATPRPSQTSTSSRAGRVRGSSPRPGKSLLPHRSASLNPGSRRCNREAGGEHACRERPPAPEAFETSAAEPAREIDRHPSHRNRVRSSAWCPSVARTRRHASVAKSSVAKPDVIDIDVK